VRFIALACDYDGTLASGDRIGPEVLAALERARRAGTRLILVTGRTFFELTRVCDRLDLFDGVVAENGAVLYVPSAGLLRDQAPPVPPRLLAELDQRGILYQAGRVIVSTARGDEPGVRAALAATGIGLTLVFNRAFLMLVPQGVSKGSGVTQMIRHLGLSAHDVLGLGDAENDLELFESCGFSGCPADAVPELRARADWVFPGTDGRAIAAAIDGPILKGELPGDGSPRHRVAVGWAPGTAAPVAIPSRGVNLLLPGDPGAGKSWLAGALVERLHQARYAVCVIDPEGDYRVLGRLPGITWLAPPDEAVVEEAMAQFERDPSAGVVLDLSAHPHATKLKLMATALALTRDRRRRIGVPHWVVLDEAHYSLHRQGIDASALDLDRKGFCLVTYNPSWLRPEVLQAVDLFVLARTTDAHQLAFLGDALTRAGPDGRRALEVLPDLPPGEFLLIRPAAATGAVTFAAAPRATPHVRHLRKYADCRLADAERFVFRHPDGRVAEVADSLRAFCGIVRRVAEAVLADHAGRGDFSRWVLDVFSDEVLGHDIRKLEIRSTRGEVHDFRRRLEELVARRYATGE
jgi:hydroxymethylpyrimidine pyrophosphatase-like HAD family hydrolase